MERSRGAGKRGQRGKSSVAAPSRVLARAPKSGLPFQLCLGSASRLPHLSAPGRARGNTLPRGLFEPGRRVCQRVPRTLTSTPTPARHHCLPSPRAVPGTQERGRPARRLFSPEPSRPGPESRLSWNPDIASHPRPALVAWTDNLSTKRNQPKVRARGRREETSPHQV